MVITDARFGGEVLLNTGRIRTFDSIECLANYVNAQSDTTTIHEILVSDVDHAELIPLADAVFAKGGPSTTPMGMGFVAHTRRHGLPAEQGTLSWEEVLRLVRDAPFGAPVSAPDSSAHALSQ
jgi:copper chaperone NosL